MNPDKGNENSVLRWLVFMRVQSDDTHKNHVLADLYVFDLSARLSAILVFLLEQRREFIHL